MVDPRYLLSAAFFDKQFQVQVHVRVTVARYHKFYICLIDRRYRPVNRLIGLHSARLFRLADKNIELGTYIRWFLSLGGAVTNSDYEKISLFIADRGVFLRLVTPRLLVDFLFFLVCV